MDTGVFFGGIVLEPAPEPGAFVTEPVSFFGAVGLFVCPVLAFAVDAGDLTVDVLSPPAVLAGLTGVFLTGVLVGVEEVVDAGAAFLTGVGLDGAVSGFFLDAWAP